MMTSTKYYVAWVYIVSDKRNTLSSHNLRPCVEAARVFALNASCVDIEVRNVDTGEPIDWRAPQDWEG